MSNAALIRELTQRIGLNPDSIGAQAVDSAIATRRREVKAQDRDEYATLALGNESEFQNLVEEIVVSETWFFRGADLFELLINRIRQEVYQRTSYQPIRILSLACSTGEEPYSLAMLLINHGLPLDRIRIVAIDISRNNIAAAQRGIYKEFSFRQTKPAVRQQFFTETTGGFELNAQVRQLVQFRASNLLDTKLTTTVAPADIILCRNAFIYFTPGARQQAIQQIKQLLVPGGIIAIGHAESSDFSGAEWQRLAPESACAFQYLNPERRTSEELEQKLVAVPLPVVATTEALVIPSQVPVAIPGLASQASRTTKWELPLEPPPGRSPITNDCWNAIGAWGEQSCPELEKYVHCHHCPVFSKAGRKFLDSRPPEGYRAEWAKRLTAPIDENRGTSENLLVFRLCREWFALAVKTIVEVTTPRAYHRVPHCNEYLHGLVNIRGELQLVVRLPEIMELQKEVSDHYLTGKTRLLVIGKGLDCWAFFVDEVDRVHQANSTDTIEVPATASRPGVRLTRGVFPFERGMAGLIDDARLFEAIRGKVK